MQCLSFIYWLLLYVYRERIKYIMRFMLQKIFLIKETFYIVAFLMFKVRYFQSQSGS